MAKKKKQQQPKVANSANINERKEKKDRQDKNKAKEVKNIVVERPKIFQLDFKESSLSQIWPKTLFTF